LLTLILHGCHLFADGSIPCTADELPDCAEVEGDADTDTDADSDTDADADADSDADSDADTDSDTDTDIGDPEAAVALSLNAGASAWRFLGIDETGAEAFDVGGSGALTGAPMWVPGSGNAAVVTGTELWVMNSDGASFQSDAGVPLVDAAYSAASDTVWAVSEEGLWGDQFDGTGINLYANDFARNAHVLVNNSAVWIIDLGKDGRPDLLRYTQTEGLSVEHEDYDTIEGRSIGAYLGPDDRVWVCSEGGGTWAVDAIASGDTSPNRLAQGALTDVIDCGYDPGTDEVLMISKSQGVFRVQADNTTTHWVSGLSEVIVRGEVVPADL